LDAECTFPVVGHAKLFRAHAPEIAEETISMNIAAPSQNSLVRRFHVIAILAGVLVLVQAFLAGRGLFLDFDLIKVHGYVGEITFVVALFLLVAAWIGRQEGVFTTTEVSLCVVLIVLLAVQFALGYGGRNSGTAASLHIPNGILITGVVSALIALSLRRPASSPPAA
jgi:hypothetical protein